MRPQAAPSDFGILVYLAYVSGVALVLALTLYWLMLPTVLPNRGLAAYKPPVAASVFLLTSTATSEGMVRSADAAAKEANGELGLEPRSALAAGEPLPPSAKEPEKVTHSMRPLKEPKRVVRVQRPETPRDPWQSWGYAQRSYGESWFR